MLLDFQKGGFPAYDRVDEQGMPTDCAVLTMESLDDFIKATCSLLMKRATFKPARDRAGKAVPGIFVSSVRWEIAH